MLIVPEALQRQFAVYAEEKGMSGKSLGAYQKWLRYYLDFCRKYQFAIKNPTSLPAFIKKLQDKRQSLEQQQQATKAIQLFNEICFESKEKVILETAQSKIPYRSVASGKSKTRNDYSQGEPGTSNRFVPLGAAPSHGAIRQVVKIKEPPPEIPVGIEKAEERFIKQHVLYPVEI